MADPRESDLSGKLGVGAGIPLVKKCVLRDCSWKMGGRCVLRGETLECFYPQSWNIPKEEVVEGEERGGPGEWEGERELIADGERFPKRILGVEGRGRRRELGPGGGPRGCGGPGDEHGCRR